jgi:hypothetical protein
MVRIVSGPGLARSLWSNSPGQEERGIGTRRISSTGDAKRTAETVPMKKPASANRLASSGFALCLRLILPIRWLRRRCKNLRIATELGLPARLSAVVC